MQTPAADADREALWPTFIEDGELYGRARPGYPDAVFDDLIALSALSRAGRVLEIGCGTGQAMVPMA